jgi:ABC-2 type transport system ATP-binding protein
MPAILVQALVRQFGERRALDGVSFSVEPGEIFGLLGPNGGGKTTLFRILSTALDPTLGSAAVLGLDVVRDRAAVRRRIGVVFQSPSLDPKLTVIENLVHQGHLYGLRGSDLRGRIDEMLARLVLADRARDRVEKLSGGLQRRVELAKGFLHQPEVLLLDEPSTGLDPGARRDLWDYLLHLKSRGVTALLTTHLMDEADRCDRLAILDRGRVVAAGAPETLRSEIGGHVVSVRSADPRALCDEIRGRFGGEPAVVDGTVRVERPDGAAFVPQLVGAFPGRILSVTVARPTLEDVFIRRTGRPFEQESV